MRAPGSRSRTANPARGRRLNEPAGRQVPPARGTAPLGDAAGRPDVGSLVSRNVIPSPRFHRSSWQITEPNTAAQVMGRYYPMGSYMSRAQFQAKGCPFGQTKHKG
jgi:hypothetical protein